MFVVPLGGSGQRFRDNGYTAPKALVPLHGRPMLFYLLDCVPHGGEVLLICGHEYDNYDLTDLVAAHFSHLICSVHRLTKPTRGAAETLFLGLSQLQIDTPVLCMDGDTFHDTADTVARWHRDNTIFVFTDSGVNPVFSYVELQGDKVLRIAEKERISDQACVGMYGFRSAREFCDACRAVIDANRQAKGEFYTSVVIQYMLENGNAFNAVDVGNSGWHCVGTPLQLRLEALKIKEDRKYRFCFDVDGTLVHCSRDYSQWTPIARNIAFLKFLHASEHVIILHTARRMRTHQGNVGAVIADIAELTIRMLNELQIPYDELIFGKPFAHFYIDDLAVDAHTDLEKSTGFYNRGIAPRSFHSLRTKSSKVIRKEGPVHNQIEFYRQIPNKVRDLFPAMLDYADDGSWYEMQYLESSLPFSQLFVSELLTHHHFSMLLGSLERLHTSATAGVQDIYGNYSDKMKRRVAEYPDAYASLKGSETLSNRIMMGLQGYEDRTAGMAGVIHGDPVFTNVLIDSNERLKFIDMRGSVGGRTTIFGDIFYDYAKVYQSLTGYDEVLHGVRVNERYRSELVSLLQVHVGARWPDVELITSSLFFSLIPLHDTVHHNEFYALAESLCKRSSL